MSLIKSLDIAIGSFVGDVIPGSTAPIEATNANHNTFTKLM